MEFEKQFLGKLIVVGSHALRHNMTKEALTIAEGVKEVLPEDPNVLFSWSVAKISSFQPEEAIETLVTSVLPKNPNNAEMRCYLGLAYKMTGRHAEGDEILYSHINANDEKQQQLANKLINYAETLF